MGNDAEAVVEKRVSSIAPLLDTKPPRLAEVREVAAPLPRIEWMVTEGFSLSTVIPAAPLRVYRAWLDGREHGAFTGRKAEVEPGIGGAFVAGDGYIRGRTLALSGGRRIVQAWRTSDFPAASEDSVVEILLEEAPGGTKLTLHHTGLPEGQGARIRDAWIDGYFEPMKRFFSPRPRRGRAKGKEPARRRARQTR